MEKVINHPSLCSPGFRVPRLEGQLLLADRACLEAGDSLPGWPLVTAASGAILPYHVGPFSHFSNKLSARTDIIRQKATLFEFCVGKGVLKSFYFSHSVFFVVVVCGKLFLAIYNVHLPKVFTYPIHF